VSLAAEIHGMKLLLAFLVASIISVASASALSSSPPRIAFSYSDDVTQAVVTLAPDGGDLANLTPGLPSGDPSWSPDGARIAFDSQHAVGSIEVFTMSADESDQKQITTGSVAYDSFDTAPHWSPRGDEIEFERRTNQDVDLWVVRPDGSDQRRLTFDGGAKQSVSWSPDGTRLVYALKDSTGSRIFTVGLAGDSQKALSLRHADDASPAWSPDGTKIVFAAPDLTVMDADGSNRHRIAEVSADSPAWSPDGSHVAFVANHQVFVVAGDGTGERRLTGQLDDHLPARSGEEPSWWPDGSRLFYLSQRGDEDFTTFVVNADGTCEERFGPPGVGFDRYRDPAWQPGTEPLPPVTRCADLRVSIFLAKKSVAAGKRVWWRVRVDNDGNQTATGVHVDITMSAGSWTLFTTGTGECGGATASRVVIDCEDGKLAPGQTEWISGNVLRRTPGPVVLHATTLADQLDTDLTSNADTAAAVVRRAGR
jgi:Tol biopolymer transport system component